MSKVTAIFKKNLQKYAVDNKVATNIYHTALCLFDKMDTKAYHSKEYHLAYTKWLNTASTLALKEALSGIGYEDNLINYNAMALLDTVAAKK